MQICKIYCTVQYWNVLYTVMNVLLCVYYELQLEMYCILYCTVTRMYCIFYKQQRGGKMFASLVKIIFSLLLRRSLFLHLVCYKEDSDIQLHFYFHFLEVPFIECRTYGKKNNYTKMLANEFILNLQYYIQLIF